jgi:hypothetical protein
MNFTRVLGKTSVNAIRVQKANARMLGRAVGAQTSMAGKLNKIQTFEKSLILIL